jgi:iron complex outermembrane receptor protein
VAALLLKVTDNFDATLRVMFQNSADHGFPATFAPLPAFTPDYTLNRAFDVQPHASDVWALPSLDLNYKGEGWSFVSSSSFFLPPHSGRRGLDLRHAAGLDELLPGQRPAQSTLLWDGEHFHDQITEEMRVAFDPVAQPQRHVGAFYSQTHTKFYIPPTYANGLTGATAEQYGSGSTLAER